MMHPASIASELAAPSLRRYPLSILDEPRKRFTALRTDPDHARVLTVEMIAAEVERRRALRDT